MNKIIFSLILIATVVFASAQAKAATATANVTAKVYLPISLGVIDHGNYVFTRTSTNPTWTGSTSVDATRTVYSKISITGEALAAVTVTVPAITWFDGSSNTILSTTSTLARCSTLTTGSYPSGACTSIPAGGVTNIWLSPVGGASHTANVVLNNSGTYTAVATVQVDY